MGRWVEVEDARVLRPEDRALIKRWHESARPVVRAIHGMAARVGENHVRRQVVCLAPQAINYPAAKVGSAGDSRDTAVKVADGDLMPIVPGVHGSQDADVIG